MAFFECTIGGSGDGSTLTVTCYSGFAGLTISITNGVDTFTEVCPSTSPYEVVFDGLADGTWTLSTVYSGDTYTKTVEINAVAQFYPTPDGATATPTDDIQTWLQCANIFDKNYTTIAQVLADASTLQALIASNNAADYMARSTTWASSVVTDANAMTYIGANNYCSDALLANNTWCSAICNSAYFESVLNAKVPTMTSNTTPSGKAFGSAIYAGSNADYYMAFDNNDSDACFITNGNDIYLGYMFATNVAVKKVQIKSSNGGSYTNQTFKVQGSNSQSNGYTDLGTITINQTTSLVTANVGASNITKYKYYRAYVPTKIGSYSGVKIDRLQFYGRKDV